MKPQNFVLDFYYMGRGFDPAGEMLVLITHDAPLQNETSRICDSKTFGENQTKFPLLDSNPVCMVKT